MTKRSAQPAAISSELAELEAKVARMRALGVTRWGDIELGPAPAPADRDESDEERRRREAEARIAAAQHRHRVLFAASGTVPKLPREPRDAEATLDRVVPRMSARGRAGGGE